MPRYFFDTIENGERIVDSYGLEIDVRETVAKEAETALAEMAGDRLPDGPRHEFVVEARDESGAVIYRASLVFTSEWSPNPA